MFKRILDFLLPFRKLRVNLKSHVIAEDCKENFFLVTVHENPNAPKSKFYGMILNLAFVSSINGVKGVVAAPNQIGTQIRMCNGRCYFSDESIVSVLTKAKLLGYGDDNDDDDNDDDDEPTKTPGPPGITKEEFEAMFST